MEIAETLQKVLADYDETINSAKDVDAQFVATSKREVQQALYNLSPEQLRQIVKFKFPMLVMVPGNSFADKIKGINAHKPYRLHRGSKDMEDVSIQDGNESPFLDWQSWQAAKSNSVIVADAFTRTISRSSTTENHSNNKKFSRNFAREGMTLINHEQYLVLMQRVLRRNSEDTSRGFFPPHRVQSDIPVALNQERLFQKNPNDRNATLAFAGFDGGIKFVFTKTGLVDQDKGTEYIPVIELLKYK